MKFDKLRSRINSMKELMGDPIRKHGASYRGRFGLKGRCVEGWVTRSDSGPSGPPDYVTISYSDTDIATIREFTGGPPDYRFGFDAGFDITAADVLQERFKVVAINNIGLQFVLLPDGRTQVPYIQGTYIRNRDLELTIDFIQDGNAGPYLRDGWCNIEPRCTWTRGKVSLMEIPVKEAEANYHIEMQLVPYLIADKLPSQDLDVYVNDDLVTRFCLRAGDKNVTFEVPRYLVVEQSIRLRFELPDAARPCDLNPDSKDKRVLAFAFRKLALSRQLDADA